MYNGKRNFYTENTIYPKLGLKDFNVNLFPKVKRLIHSHNPNHPWLKLDNKKLLEIAGLWRKDYYLNEQGYTLASVLLFGKDHVIQSILPHYKIDALVRVNNLQRYDDRLYIQTNLIDTYDLLIDFVNKHLPDTFYIEGNQRLNLRNIIFREIVSNIIIHREYTNAFPCSFIIEKNKVITENGNNPRGQGPIITSNFTPFPKNPILAKFFIQLGRVDELGSGLLNITRYLKHYVRNGNPLFLEGPNFYTEIPIPTLNIEGLNEGFNEGLNEGINEGLKSLIKTITNNPGLKHLELSQHLENRPIKTIERQISTLIKKDIIERKGSRLDGGYFIKKNNI